MHTLKNYFHLFRLKGFIEDALAIKEFYFIKDQQFKNIINAADSMQKIRDSDVKKTINEFFQKNRYNQKQTLRLLMIVHEILRQTERFELSDIIVQVLQYCCEMVNQIQEQKLKGIDTYLRKNFTVPYTAYLIKAFKKESREDFMQFKFRKKQQFKGSIVNGKSGNSLKFKQLQRIEMNFRVFNLVTEIVKFNSDLHQMGRFYSEHQYAINFYLQMLRDFQIYFNIIQYSFLELTQLSQNQLNSADAQRVYLFMSQSERCVNKMNSFYYNKYLFYYVNNKINLKMQLQIPKDFYPVLNRSCRRVQNKLSFDQCLTATHPGHKIHQPDTKDTNRSKNNDIPKIIQSIAYLTQTLEQIQNLEKIQLEKQIDKRQAQQTNRQQYMKNSAIF